MQQRNAFTLVELSIVLVILGLLVGGVLAGQSLIRAAELRSVTTQYNAYVTALGTFRDKYFSLPGDMTNAQSFWGVAHATPATCVTTVGTGTLTCNGNGDGSIGDESTTYYEWFRAWQHLANAGLIEGSFTGVSQSLSSYNSDIGWNIPRGKLGNSGWNIMNPQQWSGDSNYFATTYGNTLVFGAQTSGGWTDTPIVKAEEAFNIDTKLDDGKPHTGIMVTYKTAPRPNCVVGTNDSYNLMNTSIGCHLLIKTGF